jgi:hypothetical protein
VENPEGKETLKKIVPEEGTLKITLFNRIGRHGLDFFYSVPVGEFKKK